MACEIKIDVKNRKIRIRQPDRPPRLKPGTREICLGLSLDQILITFLFATVYSSCAYGLWEYAMPESVGAVMFHDIDPSLIPTTSPSYWEMLIIGLWLGLAPPLAALWMVKNNQKFWAPVFARWAAKLEKSLGRTRMETNKGNATRWTCFAGDNVWSTYRATGDHARQLKSVHIAPYWVMRKSSISNRYKRWLSHWTATFEYERPPRNGKTVFEYTI